MTNAIVTITAGQLPQGFCFQNPQQYYEAIIAATTAYLPGNFSTFNFGNSTPAVADQDKPWIRTDAFGNFDRLYTYNGQWVSPHPTPPSDSERRIWVGTEADLWAYDGGDGNDPTINPPTDTTGAMWVRATNFNFRVPFGAGTNPVTYGGNPATVIAVNDTGGEEQHILSISEMPAHNHQITEYQFNTGGGGTQFAYDSNGDGTARATLGAGGTLPHNNMMPYLGVLFMKRSARKYYVV